MWTAQNRRRYDRSQLRYPSDLTDDEWAHVAPLIPPAKAARQQALRRRPRSDERDYVFLALQIDLSPSPGKFAGLRGAKLLKSLTISYPSQ